MVGHNELVVCGREESRNRENALRVLDFYELEKKKSSCSVHTKFRLNSFSLFSIFPFVLPFSVSFFLELHPPLGTALVMGTVSSLGMGTALLGRKVAELGTPLGMEYTLKILIY